MKRIATSKLDHENWNQKEEVEERGQFQMADRSVVANRKTIVAKRKSKNVESANVFKSFTGFKSNTNNEENYEKHMLNLKNLNAAFCDKIQKHISENPTCILTPLFEDYGRHLVTIRSKYPLKKVDEVSPDQNKKTESNLFTFKPTSNESKPDAIMKEEVASNSTAEGSMFNFSSTANSSSFQLSTSNIPTFSFSKFESKSTFPSFGMSNSDKPIFGDNTNKDNFSFSSNTSENKTSGFISSTTGSNSESMVSGESKKDEMPFGTSIFSGLPTKSFMFGTNSGGSLFSNASTASSGGTNENKEDDEEYVPPVAETKEVKEEGSVYETRAKLFYQQDGNWKDKGVGLMFIKPSAANKFQLIMRADNNLGTILLNTLITDQMPLSVTKNNVSLVAFTNFASKEMKSTPLLVRVKTAEKAEELLKEMNKQLGK